MASLDDLITQRIQEAQDKNIEGKAYTILRYLNSASENLDDSSVFIHTDIRISYNRIEGNKVDGAPDTTDLQIRDRNNIVFEKGSSITSYGPGSWENDLDALYTKALDRKNTVDAEEKQKRENAARKLDTAKRQKFGL